MITEIKSLFTSAGRGIGMLAEMAENKLDDLENETEDRVHQRLVRRAKMKKDLDNQEELLRVQLEIARRELEELRANQK